MAEHSISPQYIKSALDQFVDSYEPSQANAQEVGYVTEAADGIAHIEGLPGTMSNELLRFQDGTLGLAMNLDVREIGAIVLGDCPRIAQARKSTVPVTFCRFRSETVTWGVWLTRWVTRLMVWVKSKTWWGAARWNCRPPA